MLRQNPLPDHSRWLGMLLCGAILCGSWPLTAAAQKPAKSTRQLMEGVSQLPVREKERLALNLARYRQMSPSEREKYREIQARCSANGELADIAKRYEAWLHEIPADDRQAILNESDPKRRQELVARLMTEQHQLEKMGFLKTKPIRDRLAELSLGADDLRAVFAVIENHVKQEMSLTSTQTAQLQTAQGVARNLLLLKLTLEHHRGTPGPPIPREVMDSMLAAVKAEPFRTKLASTRQYEKAPRLIGLMMAGLAEQFVQEIGSQTQPHTLFQEMVAGLKPDRQEKLKNMSSEERQDELKDLFFRKQIVPLLRQLQPPRPGGGWQGGGPPPDEMRGGGRRRPPPPPGEGFPRDDFGGGRFDDRDGPPPRPDDRDRPPPPPDDEDREGE